MTPEEIAQRIVDKFDEIPLDELRTRWDQGNLHAERLILSRALLAANKEKDLLLSAMQTVDPVTSEGCVFCLGLEEHTPDCKYMEIRKARLI